MDLRVSMTNYNYVFWTLPVKVQVFCDFVDDSSCTHEYLSALDPSYSRIELCSDSDSTVSLDFATPAQFFGFTFPTADPDPYFCAVMHYGTERLEIEFAHGSTGIVDYDYDTSS